MVLLFVVINMFTKKIVWFIKQGFVMWGDFLKYLNVLNIGEFVCIYYSPIGYRLATISPAKLEHSEGIVGYGFSNNGYLLILSADGAESSTSTVRLMIIFWIDFHHKPSDAEKISFNIYILVLLMKITR